MKIYLVQEFSRADYDFSTDIKHHGLYVNRCEAITKAKQVFENLKCEYEDEIDKYTYREDSDDYFDEDGEVEFEIDESKGLYEFHFGSEEDFELFSVTVEEIEFGNEAGSVYRKYKRECLIEDIKSKAEEMEIDLSDSDIEKIANRADKTIENNDSLWESYWMSIEYALKNV